MISWMTVAILSRPRGSTSGLAPWFSAIIRFWISVESLNRPPTLLTIFSSFSSSSIERSSSTTVRFQQGQEFLDATVEVIIDQHDIVAMGLVQFVAGDPQPLENGRVGFRSALAQALLQNR